MEEYKDNLNQANEEVRKVVEENTNEMKANTNQIIQNTKNESSNENNNLIIFGIIGGALLLLLATAFIVIIALTGKPSKIVAKQIVTSYIDAINDKDEEKYLKLIDTEGSIIFKEEGEKKFDQKYKNKKKYIRDYLEDEDFEDLDEAKENIGKTFKNTFKYSSTEYTFKEITSVEKSRKSKKLCVVRAKVKAKTSYGSDTQTIKFYLMKVSVKYKVVGVEKV